MASTSTIIMRSMMTTLLATGILAALADASNQAKPLQIGMAKTFFHDRSRAIVDIVAGDFKEVLKKTTGFDGKLTSTYTATEIAEKLNAKQLDFGIFFAHEFVWMQQKYPDLQPLMIAANKRHVERAYIIVQKNNTAKTMADLRGKKFDLPSGTIEPCRLYVARNGTDKDQKGPAAFFSAMQKSASQEEALNDVARGNAHATVVDTSELESYKVIRGPVFATHLRILQQSDAFPPALIAYKPGALDEATLAQFRDGLVKAHTIKAGREMMKEWNIDAFEQVPKDYGKSLADILRAYPPQAAPN